MQQNELFAARNYFEGYEDRNPFIGTDYPNGREVINGFLTDLARELRQLRDSPNVDSVDYDGLLTLVEGTDEITAEVVARTITMKAAVKQASADAAPNADLENPRAISNLVESLIRLRQIWVLYQCQIVDRGVLLLSIEMASAAS